MESRQCCVRQYYVNVFDMQQLDPLTIPPLSTARLLPTLISSHSSCIIFSLPPQPYVYAMPLPPHNPHLKQARHAVCLSWLGTLLFPATLPCTHGPVYHKNLAVVVLCRPTPSARPLTRAG
jgi:hypothetical protein